VFPSPNVFCPDQSLIPVAGCSLRAVAGMESPLPVVVPSSSASAPAHDAVAAVPGELDDLLLVRDGDAPRVKTRHDQARHLSACRQPILLSSDFFFKESFPLNLLCPVVH